MGGILFFKKKIAFQLVYEINDGNVAFLFSKISKKIIQIISQNLIDQQALIIF
jgi:hypothetical protein